MKATLVFSKMYRFFSRSANKEKTLKLTSPEWGSAKPKAFSFRVKSVSRSFLRSHTQFTHMLVSPEARSRSLSSVERAHARERERDPLLRLQHLHPAWFMIKVRRDILLSSGYEPNVALLFNPGCTVMRENAWRFINASLMKRMCLIKTLWMRSRVLWKPIKGVSDLDSGKSEGWKIYLSSRWSSQTSCNYTGGRVFVAFHLRCVILASFTAAF